MLWRIVRQATFSLQTIFSNECVQLLENAHELHV